MTALDEFRSGWRILLGCLIGVAVGLLSLYFFSLGIFIKPLVEEFQWTRGQASLGTLATTLGVAVAAMPTGRVIDRLGALPVALGSGALLAVGLYLHSVVITGLPSFVVIVAVMSLLTVGSGHQAYARLVVAHFHRGRGLALGVILTGAGLGGILVPSFLTPYVEEHGWRAGYVALAMVALGGMLLVWLLLRGAREVAVEKSGRASLRDVVTNPVFGKLAVVFFCAAIAVIGTFVHFVPMLSDAGMSAQETGTIAALIGLSSIPGRLVAGTMLDRFDPKWVTSSAFAFAAVGLLLLTVGGTSMAVPAAIILGTIVGAEADALSFLTARFYPRQVFAQANGAIFGLFLIGGSVGAVASGRLHDLTGSYFIPLAFSTAFLLVASVVSLKLPSSPAEGKNLELTEHA
jgi:predicted MFS family arabinose efflux permease